MDLLYSLLPLLSASTPKLLYYRMKTSDLGPVGDCDFVENLFFSPFSQSQDTQHNDIQNNSTQQIDIQPHDTEHKDIQHLDTRYKDIRHNGLICYTQHKDTEHNGLICDTQHYSIECRVLLY
jgi:hypothetical protein